MKQLGKPVITVPLRHRIDVAACVDDLEEAKATLRTWCRQVEVLANANVKFDMHFMNVDGITFDAAMSANGIEDTLVLARLVYNEGRAYSLKALCEDYKVTAKADDYVKEWKTTTKSKDYGTIPMDILVPYGEGDVLSNEELHELLLKTLPEESYPVWEIERGVTPILFEAERDGFLVDKNFLLRRKLELISAMLDKAKKIEALSGINNPSSPQQIGTYFETLGILSNKQTKPTTKLPNGSPSWDKDVLDWIASLGRETPHIVADLLYDFGTEELAESTFCTGWLNHIDPKNRIHSNVKQAGTVSGRSSSEKPNTQNPPKWLMEAILIPKGEVGVAWDLSQIEYRLFAHYANDPETIAKYVANPKIDYHQILADKLGIPRNPTKRVNFGILYGMGKAKTTTNIRREILSFEADDKNTPEKKMALRKHLYSTYYDALAKAPPLPENIPQDVLVKIAQNILTEYHAQNPKIKQMQAQIQQLLSVRGYVKDYFGRRAYLEMKRAYVGLNRVIQGSAADLFKKKMAELFRACKQAGLRAKMNLQIHDAIYATMPLADANAYKDLAHKIVTDCSFRVPVLMDFELALYNWKNKIKITKDTDITAEIGKLCYFK
jgi:DNA polymerase-1